MIEGGQRADPSEFPFAAMIVRPDSGRYLCTGSLIHPRCAPLHSGPCYANLWPQAQVLTSMTHLTTGL